MKVKPLPIARVGPSTKTLKRCPENSVKSELRRFHCATIIKQAQCPDALAVKARTGLGWPTVKLFKCQNCGQFLYFENKRCQKCGFTLGYIPEVGMLSALNESEGVFQPLAVPEKSYRFCANANQDVCNWLVPVERNERFCVACRHNRTIPDISDVINFARWRKLEFAKHRLFYTLLRLRLPLPDRVEHPQHGLAFHFLNDFTDEEGAIKQVMTGHDEGLISINMKEADDAVRESLRLAMGERYRTLLGHLRHEIGHYYWDRLVQDENRIEECREFFGDESRDYEEALKEHYEKGPAADWQEHLISSYAGSHPWEDFAETWAHYLHIIDTLEIAGAFGVHLHPSNDQNHEFTASFEFDPHESNSIERLIDAWLPLTFAVNAINRSMGEPDLYPFILSPPVIAKLGFIHRLVHAERNQR